MKASWIGSVVLAFICLTLGYLFSAAKDQAVGQQSGYPGMPPQVVVRPHAELPKCIVDFAPYEDPANPGRKLRVITVVDPEAKRIAVYHEELATGKVWWLSTRDIQPDLEIDQFNATSPLPSELQREIRRLQK
jgi:hypothetical protein